MICMIYGGYLYEGACMKAWTRNYDQMYSTFGLDMDKNWASTIGLFYVIGLYYASCKAFCCLGFTRGENGEGMGDFLDRECKTQRYLGRQGVDLK